MLSRRFIFLFGLIISIFIPPNTIAKNSCTKWHPGHYVLIRRSDVEEYLPRIGNEFKGIQIRFYWRDLETEKGQYDFSEIEEILTLCQKYNKHLFVQIMERTFKPHIIPLPDYLYTEQKYGGGVQLFKDGKGSMARIWDQAVIERFNKLIHKLGVYFDHEPMFEGINFPETALNIDRKAAKGFSPESYLYGLKSRLAAAKKAFPHSIVIQYINWGRRQEMEMLIDYCYKIGAGMGGPDLVPDKGRHPDKRRIPAYDYYSIYAGKMPLGVAVQSPNFTRKKGNFTLEAFYDMGVNTLKLNYIFWAAVEGKRYTHSFSQDIIPFIKEKNGKINTKRPENIEPCCIRND